MGSGPHPEIRCFPRDDVRFRTAVEQVLREMIPTRSGHRLIDRLQRGIEARYPRAVVRRQDPLASTSPTTVLYVFRDGSALTSSIVSAMRRDGTDAPDRTPDRDGATPSMWMAEAQPDSRP